MKSDDRQRGRTSIARGAMLGLLVLLSACSAALAQNAPRAQANGGFTLTKRVTEYDDKGNSFPSLTETLYFSSTGNWRYVGTYSNGQVVETIYLCGKGVFFHDHRNELLVKFGNVGPGCPGPTTSEALQANPQFVGTEYVLDRLAYLHRRKLEGLLEETYFTPETGPFPFKRISYYDRYKRVEEPVNLVFGEPDAAQLRAEDYPVVEQKPVHVGDLTPKVQEQPAPQYPAQARQAGLHGKVELQVIVDETGQVISARILSGPPLLGEAAMEAAYRARVVPILEKDGKPIKATGYLSYQFKPEPAVADKQSKPNKATPN
jgi:TonB family protein